MDDTQVNEIVNSFENFSKTTQIRENIINWYDFKEGSNILEIGCDFGQVTKFFCNTNFKVDSIEIDLEKYEYSQKILDQFKNIKLYNKNLIQYCEENNGNKFDYIIVTTSMDRLNEFVLENKKYTAFNKFMELSSGLLNENGVILIAIDNKFAIKNFSGSTFKGENSYAILEGKQKNTGVFSKKEIISILNSMQLKYKFYYPFPDYKLPSVIYTDEYLPNKNSNKLKYLVYYNPKDTIVFNEIDVVKEIVKDEMLDYFSNSYFIEISKSDINFCKAKFISFNNFRKKENKLITKIYDKYATKQNIFEEGRKHILNIEKYIDILKVNGINIIDEVKEDLVYSKHQKLNNLNDILSEYILDNNVDEALKLIDFWYDYIKSKFSNFVIANEKLNDSVFGKYNIDISKEKNDKLTFLKYGFFDFIFENIFVKMNENKIDEMLVYDQEWCEENLPIEFILYRALNNLFYYNNKISKFLSLGELYKKYNIEEYICEFKELERKIQENLTDNEIVNEYQNTYCALTTLEGLTETLYYSQKENKEIREQHNNFIKHVEQTNNNWQAAMDKANQKIKELEAKLNKNNIFKNIFKK